MEAMLTTLKINTTSTCDILEPWASRSRVACHYTLEPALQLKAKERDLMERSALVDRSIARESNINSTRYLVAVKMEQKYAGLLVFIHRYILSIGRKNANEKESRKRNQSNQPLDIWIERKNLSRHMLHVTISTTFSFSERVPGLHHLVGVLITTSSKTKMEDGNRSKLSLKGTMSKRGDERIFAY
ncbi:hypothetical protein GUJ93_ZPchr0002g24308 [Zizania palustris]|uniref:Uncharacterized protein n=1 Tax=Zizania palustris TaxID=103762 RepID=A0A8J5RVH7_ZIZPA|nr:hypothetical protein GUJ93_ZPchr0002g24308 [Zizania palustris]